ncbi:dihydroorotate dehydrogenase electron transfer subunit [Jeotgalibacillus proteolyticus]|uniref:Dihydroorotate dehydrogenase B (NAD(+)), electron transfer subunit n=1 Tax=Jeotgalibacillus proteolyticus TaxID=2082395 RepID=A0A2S5GGF0_9BACL|nr:dihydroorotate dehydrogenase electron transfer subunit [Jeotgalibacillus proteolyticus]PPA72112.1 dihydroorotate dehydrogenase electron transfer subunit [Jeotgalibacillus proteolyticus]
MIQQENMTIISHRSIAKDIYELILQGSLTKQMTSPGQFVHIRVTSGSDPLLRRPISICSIDQENGQFTMLYRVSGSGTRVLSEQAAGATVNVLGPLGNGFPVEYLTSGQKALLIGGGIGVPPLYELSKRLTERGIEVTHVLGFQQKDAVFYQDRFEELGKTHIATADGSHGTKGFVTDVIEKLSIEADAYFTCGPSPMLKAVEQSMPEVDGFISMEQRMGCGVGACLACVCQVQGDETGLAYKKVCTDGPVFQSGEVVV